MSGGGMADGIIWSELGRAQSHTKGPMSCDSWRGRDAPSDSGRGHLVRECTMRWVRAHRLGTQGWLTRSGLRSCGICHSLARWARRVPLRQREAPDNAGRVTPSPVKWRLVTKLGNARRPARKRACRHSYVLFRATEELLAGVHTSWSLLCIVRRGRGSIRQRGAPLRLTCTVSVSNSSCACFFCEG